MWRKESGNNNIMLDRNMQITSSDSGRIIEIPYLYRLDRKEIGTEIIAKINREGYLQMYKETLFE